MGRHLFSVVIIFSVSMCARASSGKTPNMAYFPLCPQNTSIQSERLNQFHDLMYRLSQKLNITQIRKTPQTDYSGLCEEEFKRSLAAIHNLDGFLSGSYLIEGDSVQVNLEYVNTVFVDKTQRFDPVNGSLNRFNDIISELAIVGLRAISFETDTLHRIEISNFIKDDGVQYSQASNQSSHASLEIGKIAYSMEKYDKAVETLIGIMPGDETYGEAQFIIGKCVLLTGNYSQALRNFKNAQRGGYKEFILEDYIYQAERLNKPWDWFDTEKKRRDWWISLNTEESNLIIRLMNELHIHNKSFENNYVYTDADIQALFKTEVLPLVKLDLRDLTAYRYFTRCNMIIFDKTKLGTATGIQFFRYLKLIESNRKEILQLEDVEDVVKGNSLTVLYR